MMGFWILNWLLRMSMLLLTLFLVGGVYKEYSEGATKFMVSQQPLSTYDNPTVTVCFWSKVELEPGIHFTYQYWYWNGGWTLLGTDADKSRFLKIMVADGGEVLRNCFMFKKLREDLLQNKYVELYFNFLQEDIVHAGFVYLTTEENAYGVVAQRWFDGEVTEVHLKKHSTIYVVLDDNHQFEYLNNSCTSQSFYQCLASFLRDSKGCTGHGGICEAVSLPSPRLPPCQTQTAHNCSLKAFWEAFQNSSLCRMEKTCNIMEYRIDLDSDQHDPAWTYRFVYTLDSPTISTERQIQPYKVVHSEYLVWSLFTFVAYTGGILGLTLGFSSPGMIGWIFDKLYLAKSYPFKRKNKIQKKKGGWYYTIYHLTYWFLKL